MQLGMVKLFLCHQPACLPSPFVSKEYPQLYLVTLLFNAPSFFKHSRPLLVDIAHGIMSMFPDIAPPPPSETASEPRDEAKEKNNEPDFISDGSSDCNGKTYFAKLKDSAFSRRCWQIVTWMPARCRYDIDHPHEFGIGLNLLFAFVSYFFDARRHLPTYFVPSMS